MMMSITEQLVRDYISQAFPDALEHAGCTHIGWREMEIVLDVDDGAIRLGVYEIVGNEVSEHPHIWVEFRDGATSDQIIGFINSLTDLP